jgi:hypothetical protein
MGNNGCGISRFLTLAARERTARLLKKVSASNPERYQIIRRSFRVLNLSAPLALGGFPLPFILHPSSFILPLGVALG